MNRETGFTLIELIVVIAIIGLMAAISGMAVAGLKLPRETEQVASLRRARRAAIESGTSVRADGNTPRVLFLPDGRALGPDADPLTGAPR